MNSIPGDIIEGRLLPGANGWGKGVHVCFKACGGNVANFQKLVLSAKETKAVCLNTDVSKAVFCPPRWH